MPPEALTAKKLESALFSRQDRITLSGRGADGYIRILTRLLDRGRLNRNFPERKSLVNLYRFLSPKENHYVYKDIEVGLYTGLPTEPEITRIKTDQQIAPKVISREEKRNPDLREQRITRSKSSDDKYIRGYRYHRLLHESKIHPTFQMNLNLRWVEPEKKTATFITTLDRFDLSEELFCRYTILLSHTASRWSRPQVRLEGDDLEYTRNFQNLIAKTTAHDSELAFILLSDIKSVAIESITRSKVGPLWFSGTDGAPAVQKIVDDHPGEFILNLTTDRTAIDIDNDSNDDPLSRGYREALVPEARELVETRRKQLGYHVRRERKFVCTKGVSPALKKWVKNTKKPCVIYEVR